MCLLGNDQHVAELCVTHQMNIDRATGETEVEPLEVYSLPAAPPLSLQDISKGYCDPDHISSFVDCHPTGGEAGWYAPYGPGFHALLFN